ncbi:reverse transcriptase domain-containing protein [Tanacetum coccineum]
MLRTTIRGGHSHSRASFSNNDPLPSPKPGEITYPEFKKDLKVVEPKDIFKFCSHKILLEDDYQPSVQHQRRVNPKIHDVIKKEVEKLLDAGLIYPISDSPWVSPVHCVPKKGGMTVVTNEENELVPTRLVTGWRVCIDYRKLNEATCKDHFPLPFMDQMLERLAGNEFYCFLDGFSGYFQIPIDPKDQEKTTFTCPYGTFAYRRMPFGLCNAPGTFQRCMMAIFHDMIEKTMEVFMDDFSVFGDSFSSCLANLDRMLKRCEDTKLALNWEKSHFMVKEGIVLGHKISRKGIEVDKAKVDIYQRLSKSLDPDPLLEKNTPFIFQKIAILCLSKYIEKKLTEAPFYCSKLDQPFEFMCDASDYAIGVVLGQRTAIRLDRCTPYSLFMEKRVTYQKIKKLHDSRYKGIESSMVGDQVFFSTPDYDFLRGKDSINCHRLKHYYGGDTPPLVIQDLQTFPKDN